MIFRKVSFSQLMRHSGLLKLILCIGFSFLFSFYSAYGFQKTNKIQNIHNELTRHKKEDSTKVNLLNTLGFEYWIVDTNKSIEFGTEALQLSEKLAYTPGQAKANRVIGVAYWAQGNLNKALQYLNTSHINYQRIQDKKGLANTRLNIGMVYADLKEYDKALLYYEQAINKFTALQLKGRIATTFTKIGTILIEQRKDKKALKYLTDALQMHMDNNFTYGISEAHNRLGLLYLNKNEVEQASYHIKKSMALGSEVNDVDGLTNNHIINGKILRLSKKLDEAVVSVNKGLKLAIENDLKKYQLFAYEELKELKKRQYKPKEAFIYYEKFLALKDSLFNSEKSKQIAYLEFENELKIKDNQLLTLKDKERKDNLIKLILIIGVVAVTICGYVIYVISRQKARKNKELSKKTKELLESAYALTQKDLENSELKQIELKRELNVKNKELTGYALNLIKKNEVVHELQTIIERIKKSSSLEKTKLIADLNKIIRKNLSIDRDWEDFSRFFEDAHQGFYDRLKSKHVDLSSSDLKLCSLVRLNFNIKETANILGISPESVKTARYRLRKKLALNSKQDILTYLLHLEKQIA